MTIAVFANNEQWKEIQSIETNIEWIRVNSLKEILTNAVAFFLLEELNNEDIKALKIPVFLNSVTTTLKELNTLENVCRINGWNGFLLRPNWEIAGLVNEEIKTIFLALNKKMVVVPDEPGFIAARIISMIINEAWYALEEEVSTKNEIDIAMKLGTNYPYGPFEWGTIIGEQNIVALLLKLSAKNKKYLPAPLLKKI